VVIIQGVVVVAVVAVVVEIENITSHSIWAKYSWSFCSFITYFYQLFLTY